MYIIDYLSTFPEELFLHYCEEYYQDIIKGIELACTKKCLIVGLARNCSKALINNIFRIEKLGSIFAKYKVFIYENDSTDNTKDILNVWSKRNLNVKVSLNTLDKKFHNNTKDYERTSDMAWYRNQYIDYIRNSSADYVIVYDFDILGGFSYDGVIHSIYQNLDVVGSNSLIFSENQLIYYDTFALKGSSKLSWKRGDPIEEVMSCFGGLAIYKKSCFDNVEYSGKFCEHISLHEDMIKEGYKVWLNPNQIVLYDRTRYSIK